MKTNDQMEEGFFVLKTFCSGQTCLTGGERPLAHHVSSEEQLGTAEAR